MGNKNICKRCGARKPDWPPFGPLISVLDNDVAELLQFFQGELDDVKCGACGGRLATPSISVSFDHYAEDLVFYGPLARVHPDDIKEIEKNATASGTSVVAGFNSLDALREAAWQRLSPRAALVYRALDNFLVDASDATQWEQTWAKLTSSAFAATVVARLARLPVLIDVELAERIRRHTGEQVTRGLQQLQARVWYSICSRWKVSAPPGGTLEQDFREYVAPGALIAGAPEFFFESLETLDPKTLDPAANYAFEATRATLYAALGAPNPRSEKWASLYLVVEVLRSTSDAGLAKMLDALAVSEERARATVSRQALSVAVERALSGDQDGTLRDNPSDMPAIQAAVTKAGHPDLLGIAFTGARMQQVGGEDLRWEDIAQVAGWAVQQWSSQPKELEVFLKLITQSLPPAIDAEELLAITERLEDIHGDNHVVRAVLRYWLGEILCMRRRPKPFLKRIGVDPQSWEADLPLDLKAVLWLWRARALRLTGNSVRALDLLRSLVGENERSATGLPPHLRRQVLGDLALDYVNIGYFEQALQIQVALLEESGSERSPWHLRSLATTYEMLGRDKDALPLLREALSAATRPHQLRHKLAAQLASVLSRCGQVEETLNLLNGIPDEALSDPEVFVKCSVAWLNSASQSEMGDRLLSVAEIAAEFAQSSLARGDTQLHMTACRLFAALTERIGVKETTAWELVDAEARAFEGSPDPKALVVLARSDWETGDFTSGRQRLLELPESLARRFADTRDVSVSANSLEQLGAALEALGDCVVRSGAASSDSRLVAELQRDLLGRIAARATTDLMSGFVAPDDEVIAGISEGGRSVGVLEWVSGTRGAHWLFSRVSVEGDVASWWLDPPPLDTVSLGKKVNHRLSVWHADRTGDPFDLQNWKSLENWLARELGDRLPEGGELVVIEHEEVAGLQWHVAAASRWRVSYTPSWTALLNARWAAAPIKQGLIGLAMVPKHRESAENLQALESSVSRTVELAADLGGELKSALREACDRDALMGVLEAAAVAKVLCHGFVDPDEGVVALMVAHDGVLPLADSVAANTPVGRRHRFDWRDCQHLKSAPAVLFSAACSSGQSHLAGLGEKLGLFSILRRAGTRSLVAPRWDIDPEVVLPILDNAMERYLRTGDELGEALHAACSQASEEHSRWLAWSLALEGHWK